MKTERVVIVVLLVVIAFLAYFQLSGRAKPAGEPQELWHTNTVEMWHTNTVAMWATNTVERWQTNTVLQPVTNEVVKEVPAALSELERRAAIVGFKHLNAPLVEGTNDTLYKASPIAVEVSIDQHATRLLSASSTAMRARVEEALRSRGITVAEQSPYRLHLSITTPWTTDVPRVTLFAFRLELLEKVALQRQRDVLGCPGVVWNTTSSRLVRAVNVEQEVNNCTQAQLEKFCGAYLTAKQEEKRVEARIPAIPADFLRGQGL